MIRLDHVSMRYGRGQDALSDVSFEVPAGEMVFVTGHSGAGKSTLLRLLMRRELPTRGLVVVNNKNLSKLRRGRVPYFRRELGMVFQDNKLLLEHTVFDNVALPLIVAGSPPNEIRKRVHAALDKVGLLAKEKAYPIALSGGEQQRVGIARAVVNKPPLLLADEPTGNLDAALSDEIVDLFAEFNHHGVTVLIATHDLRQLQRHPRRVLHLQHGRLVDDRAAAVRKT